MPKWGEDPPRLLPTRTALRALCCLCSSRPWIRSLAFASVCCVFFAPLALPSFSWARLVLLALVCALFRPRACLAALAGPFCRLLICLKGTLRKSNPAQPSPALKTRLPKIWQVRLVLAYTSHLHGCLGSCKKAAIDGALLRVPSSAPVWQPLLCFSGFL